LDHPRPVTGKVVFPGWDGNFLISGVEEGNERREKFLASPPLQIPPWSPTIPKVGHMTPSRPRSPNFAFFSFVPLAINMRVKFEVCIFNLSRDI